MGQGQHGEKNITVVWYIIYQLPLRPFCLFKVLPISFLGEISPKEDPISLKQHILSQIPFFEKICLKFWGRGGGILQGV